jgi:hypothetical protein
MARQEKIKPLRKAAPPSVKVSEASIQKAIVTYLRAIGVVCHSIPNEAAGGGRGAMIRMTQYKAMGLMYGVADLVAWLPYPVYIEVKTPIGKMSEHQHAFAELCKDHGIQYFLVRSVDEMQQIVKKMIDYA